MWIAISVAILIGVFVGTHAILHQSKKLTKADLDRRITGIPDFRVSHVRKVEGKVSYFAVLLDEQQRKVALISRQKINPELAVVSFDELLQVEIIEDGVTVSTTSRGGQAAGIALGALALGGVGAVIGGLSAKRVSVASPKLIELRILIRSLSNPLYSMTLTKEILELEGPDSAGLIHQLTEIKAMLDVVIHDSADRIAPSD